MAEGVVDIVKLEDDDIKLLKEKRKLYAEGELSGKLIEIVYLGD